MATATAARGGWPPMADHRALRLGMVFFLYIAQGIPLGLFFMAIPAWLAANGADAVTIGLVATFTSLPWSLKFLNGFLMDRYAFLAMGRRRAWLIGAQLLIVLGLIAFALSSPTPDQPLLIAAFSFLIMTATTFQDVAIDGIAVDIVPDEERARANGFMFGGQAFGIACGASITGFAIMQWGPTAAFLLVASLVGAILLAIAFVREREGERLFPWTAGSPAECNLRIQADAWRTVFRTVFGALTSRRSLLLSVALFLTGTAYGTYPALGAMLGAERLGWNEAQITGLQGIANLVGGAVGVLLGGWLADKLGPKRFSVLIMLAIAGMAAAMIGFSSLWSNPKLMSGFVIGWIVLDVLIKVSMLPIAMRLCDLTVGATQFAIYMALSNFGITVASALLPSLNAADGYSALFAFVGMANLLAIPFLLAARPGR